MYLALHEFMTIRNRDQTAQELITCLRQVSSCQLARFRINGIIPRNVYAIGREYTWQAILFQNQLGYWYVNEDIEENHRNLAKFADSMEDHIHR